MYFIIITFGLMLAMRGSRPARLDRPVEGMERVGRDAADLFLTVSLALAGFATAVACDSVWGGVKEHAILGLGAVTYLLSRYQKKTDVFFLAAAAIAFVIHDRQVDLLNGFSWAWAVSMGVALFQICFLGTRYKLLFSRVPASVKGWPVLCLLTAFISLVLSSLQRLVF